MNCCFVNSAIVIFDLILVLFTMSLSSLSSLSDPEQYVPRRRRVIPDRIDLFEKHDGEDFRVRYRISKEVALRICDILNLEPETRRNKAIDGITQLLICLRFFATGSFQQVLGDLVNVHKSTICRIVQKVTRKLASLSSRYIEMPSDRNELRKVAEGFFQIDGFPRVAGALDCTHVKIVSRGGSLPELYRCRKGFFSINVQAVCDSTLKIRDLIARWPGSVHDSTIFNNSHICADFERGKYGPYCLLGDSGYYNKNYLLTPFLRPQNNAEEAYNKSHIATRNTIERCFGVLKRRCPCLQKGITLNKTSTVLQVIVACVVLHNLCIELDEVEPPDDIVIDGDDDHFLHTGVHSVQTSVRTAIVNSVFS